MDTFRAPSVTFDDLIPPQTRPGNLELTEQGNPFEEELQRRSQSFENPFEAELDSRRTSNLSLEQKKALALARARLRLAGPAEVSFDDLIPSNQSAATSLDAMPNAQRRDLVEMVREIYGMPPVPDGMVFDPATGQYVDTVAEASRQNRGFWGKMATAGATAMEGVPVLGAYMRDVAGMGDPVQREIASRRMDQFAEERPKTATGLQIAGGISAVAPAVAAAPAAFGAGGGGFLFNSAASGVSGAAIGAADSAARSGGDLDAIAKGAALGGGLGLAGPGIAAGVGRTVQGVKSLVAGKSGRAAIGADKLLRRALERDGLTANDVAAGLREIGPDAIPADIAPNLRQQVEGLASMSGPAQKIIRDTLERRAAGAGQRITGALDDALGQPVNTLQTADDIIAQRSAAADPLYTSAKDQPVPFTRELESLLNRPAMQQALQRARVLAENEGIPSKQWFANVADDGTATFRNVPDVRQLDYTKRALDDMIAGAGYRTNEGRILTGLKNQLTKLVDDAVPEYAQARQAFAGPSSVLDAVEAGKGVFKNSQTPEQIRRTLATMGDSERQAYLESARASVADIMGTARNDVNAALALFDRGYNREKLALLIGDEQAQGLLSRLQAERTFALTRNQVTGNSRTASRQQVMQELGATGERPGVIKSALNFNLGDAADTVVQRISRAFNAPGTERRNEALADALLSKAELQRVSEFAQRSRLPAHTTDAIVRSFMATRGVTP